MLYLFGRGSLESTRPCFFHGGVNLHRSYVRARTIFLAASTSRGETSYRPPYINLAPPNFSTDNHIAKATSQWRPSYGDRSPSRQHCDKHHRNHKLLRSAPSTTRHSSNNHTSSAPQSHRHRHRKMYPSSSKPSDEDTNKQHTTL
jgi:hypothetical protein